MRPSLTWFAVAILGLSSCGSPPEKSQTEPVPLTPGGTPLVWQSDLSSVGPSEFKKDEPPPGPAPVTTSEADEDPNAKMEAFCNKQWPSDYRMQEYCQTQQVQGVLKINEFFKRYEQQLTMPDYGVNTSTAMTILIQCHHEWPDDYAMNGYCVEQQEQAAQRLGKL